MRLTEHARGIYVISATPFTDDGALDLTSVDPLVDFYLQHGVHGLTILGLMGEAPKLTADEAVAFVTRVLARVAGRVPVVVGASNPGLVPMKTLAARVMDLGAAGVMIAPTHGLKGDEAVENYFRAVLDTLGDIPVCVQRVGGANGPGCSHRPDWRKLFPDRTLNRVGGLHGATGPLYFAPKSFFDMSSHDKRTFVADRSKALWRQFEWLIKFRNTAIDHRQIVRPDNVVLDYWATTGAGLAKEVLSAAIAAWYQGERNCEALRRRLWNAYDRLGVPLRRA